MSDRLARFRAQIAREYAARFPASTTAATRPDPALLDHTSHRIRWNDPFMPYARSASGPAYVDLDGHRLIDYWQGHFANLFGHNPPEIRAPLAAALAAGAGLQTGLVHPIEEEVAAAIRRATRTERVRLTTSGSLGTFYASILARSFTGRDRMLKVGGGWHGSQPFGLKGVASRAGSFEHLESEGLSTSTPAEIELTRFNDVEDLRRVFAVGGDRIAGFLLEPVIGAGGGMAATPEYLREARRLTAEHGALLLCDEIITGFRLRAGDLSAAYGVEPDLLILGKVLGGGMPVAAVAGRRDVLRLCHNEIGRVKFEGGTYSAHELSLVATRAMLEAVTGEATTIYPALGRAGARMRAGIRDVASALAAPLCVLPAPQAAPDGSSLVMFHFLADDGPAPAGPDELVARRHPWVDERLLKSVLLLEDLSTRSGLGAISTAHTEADLERTLVALRRGLERIRDAGLF